VKFPQKLRILVWVWRPRSTGSQNTIRAWTSSRARRHELNASGQSHTHTHTHTWQPRLWLMCVLYVFLCSSTQSDINKSKTCRWKIDFRHRKLKTTNTCEHPSKHTLHSTHNITVITYDVLFSIDFIEVGLFLTIIIIQQLSQAREGQSHWSKNKLALAKLR